MLIDLLRAGAAVDADRPLVVRATDVATYGDVLARSTTIERALRRGLVPPRFGVRVDDVAALLALLSASSAVGFEACVYPASASPEALASLAERFDHTVVIADGPVAVEGLTTVDLAALEADGSADDPTGERVAAGDGAAPVLILTTGTTGLPKGARHDWRRLVAAVSGRPPTPEARWLLAYNINQFAGVQVLLHALATQGTLVVPTSNQPREALDAMRHLGVTHVSATPTFWRFLTTILDDDVAGQLTLQQITLGGEAVPAATLDELYRLFPGVSISQIYASTEFGSTVSVKDSLNGLPLSALERGPEAPVHLRVVDGELQARSTVGMLGYYGEPGIDDDWRPTGDLVEIRDDRVFFVGRTSEVINVGGVKVHPLPTEELVRQVPGVAIAHVYGRSSPMTGQIVAVDVVLEDGVDPDATKDAIREACAELQPAAQPRRIRIVEALQINENKIARRVPADAEETPT